VFALHLGETSKLWAQDDQRIQNKNNLQVWIMVFSISSEEMKLGAIGHLKGWLIVVAAVVAILTVRLWQIHRSISEILHWH
jgi:hypothetical protein